MIKNCFLMSKSLLTAPALEGKKHQYYNTYAFQ